VTSLTLARPWLEFDLGAPCRVLSWSLNRPGFVTTDRIVWREVRNADLPLGLDVGTWFAQALSARRCDGAVGFLTSRDIRCYHHQRHSTEGITAEAVATVGLSNAERIGTRLDRTGTDWGTINVALKLDAALSDAALIEAMSVAVEARTAAVMEIGFTLPTGIATGTGTDCVAVAAAPGDTAFAGLHTAVGEAAGRAVFSAVQAGATEWMKTVRRDG